MDAQEARIFNAILIACVIIGIIIIYFIVSMIRQHRRVVRLQRERATAEISALEKDRSRIAADLHDDLSPILSAVKMRINSFELAEEDDLEQLEKTNNAIDEVLQKMRQISFDLMPDALIRKGIVEALTQYLNTVRESSGLIIDFTAPEKVNIDEQKTINLYRVTKEIVHNTIKHAQANCLVIQMIQDKNKLSLSFTDNGRGFEIGKIKKESSGFGLRSIVNRTELMGGEIFIDSTLGKGTNYNIEIPI
ncbi:MAG: sensor histidine kinase [Candidatus Dadabacteria bacterium]